MEHRLPGRNEQLAQFLQTRRARLTPEQVGLPRGQRRRTPGLRRAEVAQLAGVSVDWYTWLEQGRNIQASGQVLESLARALRLDGNERRHLFLLAYGHLPPEQAGPQRAVSLLLQQFIERQGDNPTFVNNSRWDIVAWNRAACAVFGDYEKMTDRERNSVWRLFCTPSGRELMGDQWEKNAKRRLAQFRANYGKYVEDPWWTDMIAALHRESEAFCEWWPQHEVLHSPEGRKTVYHPVEGPLYFDHLTFDVVDSVDLQMTVNIPADPETAAKLRRLLEAD